MDIGLMFSVARGIVIAFVAIKYAKPLLSLAALAAILLGMVLLSITPFIIGYYGGAWLYPDAEPWSRTFAFMFVVALPVAIIGGIGRCLRWIFSFVRPKNQGQDL